MGAKMAIGLLYGFLATALPAPVCRIAGGYRIALAVARKTQYIWQLAL